MKCFGCGNISDSVLKSVNKVQRMEDKKNWYIKGKNAGHEEFCLLNTGADNTSIPERLVCCGLPGLLNWME